MNILHIPQANSPISTWLQYLQRLHHRSIDLGLDRVRKVAIELDLLYPAPLIITVGGTNGKGTTCRLLESILLKEGIAVGVYSSPHLINYLERVRINGKELPESSHSMSMAIIEKGRKDTSLSYFEFSTLSALQLFKQEPLKIVILEVGLGGRLDATNIVNADIAVITSIALDHTEYLGTNLASISKEKAGIFRSGKPAVIGNPDRPTELDIAVNNCNAVLYARNRDWWYRLEHDSWCWWDMNSKMHGLPLPACPIIANAATALATLKLLHLNIKESSVHYGLKNATLPGRFHVIGKNPLRVLDVAHNPHATGYLSEYIKTLRINGRIRAVVGMLVDKDISGTLEYLIDQVDIWYCTSMEVPRAASSAELATFLDSCHVKQFVNVESAWQQAMSESALDDCVLVFGSFNIVAAVMKITKIHT